MKLHHTYIAVIFSIVCGTTVSAQKISDSAFKKMSNIELGNYYMKKSHIRKAGGFGLLALGLGGYLGSTYAAAIATTLNPSDEYITAVVAGFIGSTISLVASYPVLCSGSKYKGKAEVLLSTPGLYETPSDIQGLIASNKKQQKISSTIAWTMLLGGFTGVYISAVSESGVLLLLSTISIFGSLPAWMNAALHKGRISILLGQQSIPVSYLLPKIGLTSIGLSIPIR